MTNYSKEHEKFKRNETFLLGVGAGAVLFYVLFLIAKWIQ